MNAIQIIESAFSEHKLKGLGNSAALDKTVEQFGGVYNPFLIRTHIRHSKFWN